jgi:hypothetical protein
MQGNNIYCAGAVLGKPVITHVGGITLAIRVFTELFYY